MKNGISLAGLARAYESFPVAQIFSEEYLTANTTSDTPALVFPDRFHTMFANRVIKTCACQLVCCIAHHKSNCEPSRGDRAVGKSDDINNRQDGERQMDDFLTNPENFSKGRLLESCPTHRPEVKYPSCREGINPGKFLLWLREPDLSF